MHLTRDNLFSGSFLRDEAFLTWWMDCLSLSLLEDEERKIIQAWRRCIPTLLPSCLRSCYHFTSFARAERRGRKRGSGESEQGCMLLLLLQNRLRQTQVGAFISVSLAFRSVITALSFLLWPSRSMSRLWLSTRKGRRNNNNASIELHDRKHIDDKVSNQRVRNSWLCYRFNIIYLIS